MVAEMNMAFSIAELFLLWTLAIALHIRLLFTAADHATINNTSTTSTSSENGTWLGRRKDVCWKRFCQKKANNKHQTHNKHKEPTITQTATHINTITNSTNCNNSGSGVMVNSHCESGSSGCRSSIEFARLPDMWPDVLALLAAEDACSLTSVSRRLHGVGRQVSPLAHSHNASLSNCFCAMVIGIVMATIVC
jgi:hypothetical protein